MKYDENELPKIGMTLKYMGVMSNHYPLMLVIGLSDPEQDRYCIHVKYLGPALISGEDGEITIYDSWSLIPWLQGEMQVISEQPILQHIKSHSFLPDVEG